MTNRPTFEAVLEARLSRRTLLAGAAGAAGIGLAACAGIPPTASPTRGASVFKSVPPQNTDAFVLANGYRHNVIARWGDSLFSDTPDFDTRRMATEEWLDDANAATAQTRRFGTNADAVAYFPLVTGRAARGVVCVNHEYLNAELMWPTHRGINMRYADAKEWFSRHPHAAKFMQAAHGVSVLQIRRDAEGWVRELSAPRNRRITANTPMDIHGPARGHKLMRTNSDPTGTRVFGTFANCSAGKTPWGTYLTSEENVDDYFEGAAVNRSTDAELREAYRRFALRDHSFYHWDLQDPRFDTAVEPHEPFRFGWMVEIDPNDPTSTPRKRTSLGRMQHEGANTIVGKSGHVAAYMGDDDKFEYIYKFVTRDRFDPKNPAANRDILDHGTLYCARFDDDGTGEWLPLVHDENGPLNSAAGFRDQGDVVIKVRAAADILGATPMDRPEDVEPSPLTGRIYIPCTKTVERGRPSGDWNGRRIDTGVNASNPRPDNRSGHIIEIIEDGDDARATRFRWNVFLLAGNPAAGRYLVDATELRGSLTGNDTYYAGYANAADVSPVHCPDNLGFDPQGRLWIVTDSDNKGVPNNGCFVVPTDGPERGLLRQLASGPNGCEVCGCEFAPDGRTLFLSIQHPGEGGTISKPISHWPDGNGLPARAALIAIEREDGGTI